ncbi:MAG TPA: glycerophosphodiester phosphodiesterase family protein [Allosphingosinicella sp.]|jgi:glycerophosphoryl diester phosphodiesterase
MRWSLSGTPDLERLGAQPFAHRGLHGEGRQENSRAAFRAAIAAGHGIELDVQLSRDGDAVVFHDYRLDRLTGEAGDVGARTADQLGAIRLSGTDETIPTLREVLELVGGRVPVLIEVKAPNRQVARLCLAVFRALAGYRGPVGVMSFNPEVPRWFAAHAPKLPRGLVVTESGTRGLRGRFERRFAWWRSGAQFLAYDVRDLPSRFTKKRRKKRVPVFTWTVRSDEEWDRAALHADAAIFEVPAA